MYLFNIVTASLLCGAALAGTLPYAARAEAALKHSSPSNSTILPSDRRMRKPLSDVDMTVKAVYHFSCRQQHERFYTLVYKISFDASQHQVYYKNILNVKSFYKQVQSGLDEVEFGASLLGEHFVSLPHGLSCLYHFTATVEGLVTPEHMTSTMMQNSWFPSLRPHVTEACTYASGHNSGDKSTGQTYPKNSGKVLGCTVHNVAVTLIPTKSK